MTGEPSEPRRDGPGADTTADPEAPLLTPPTVEAPSRTSVAIRLAIVVGIFVVIFGIVIPSFVDYQDVIDAIAALSPGQLLVLIGIALVAYILEGGAVAAPLPGLSIARGTGVFLAASGVKNTIPAPVDLPLRYALFRQWEFDPSPAALAVAVNGVMDQVSRLILPAVAAVLYLVEGEPQAWLISFAIIGGVIFAVLVGIYVWMIRSRAFTERVGRLVDRVTRWFIRLIKRPEPAGIPGRVVAFRDQTRELMLQRGILSLGAAVVAKLWWSFLLLVSLRVAGVGPDLVAAPEVLAVFAGVFLIMILPIAPGGAGVPEVLFIAAFTTIAGPGHEGEVTAGVFLYRIFQWFLLIPVGWVTLWILRRHAPGGLLGAHGQQDEAAATAAGGTA
jgi:uncharacterized protein (TIRG00374 family)